MRDLKDLLQEGYCRTVVTNDKICEQCKKYFGNCLNKPNVTALDFMEYAKNNFKPIMTKEDAEQIMIKYGMCMELVCDNKCEDCRYYISDEDLKNAVEVLKDER